jgi:hypothetical protein
LILCLKWISKYRSEFRSKNNNQHNIGYQLNLIFLSATIVHLMLFANVKRLQYLFFKYNYGLINETHGIYRWNTDSQNHIVHLKTCCQTNLTKYKTNLVLPLYICFWKYNPIPPPHTLNKALSIHLNNRTMIKMLIMIMQLVSSYYNNDHNQTPYLNMT